MAFGIVVIHLPKHVSMEGVLKTPEETLKDLMAVTPEDVVRVARAFKLDTVYFLNAASDEEVET